MRQPDEKLIDKLYERVLKFEHDPEQYAQPESLAACLKYIKLLERGLQPYLTAQGVDALLHAIKKTAKILERRMERLRLENI